MCCSLLWVGRRPTFPRLTAVSSALRGLTSLFGMGRGAPPRKNRHSRQPAGREDGSRHVSQGRRRQPAHNQTEQRGPHHFRVRLPASPRAISTARLNASPRFHLRPIDVVVYHGPPKRPHLGASFALRCFQRLSPPDAATRPCAWRRNRHTVGPSDPVLSY